jgi:hypothetical protein
MNSVAQHHFCNFRQYHTGLFEVRNLDHDSDEEESTELMASAGMHDPSEVSSKYLRMYIHSLPPSPSNTAHARARTCTYTHAHAHAHAH